MKYTYYISALVMGLIASFFIWIYIQTANIETNSQGRFFSAKDGIVYHEQPKEVYGILAILGLILTGLFTIKSIRKFKK